MPRPSFSTVAQRRRAVALIVALTANTRRQPQRYERQLLARFEDGEITLDQVDELMAASTHQLLYHSRATGLPTQPQLQALLERSQQYNAANGITGLLLYSEGRFVQVLEGPEAAVEALFARIQRDTRHTQVEIVSRGRGAHQFAEWSMEFGNVTPRHMEEALIAIQAQVPAPNISDSRLQALLRAFI